jgi:predicted nucleic acid-binding protein
VRYVLVDTDVVSLLMLGSSDAEKFKPHLVDRIPAISFVTVGELYFGGYNAGWGDRRMASIEQSIRRYVVLPYDDNLAKMWGRQRAKAKAAGSALYQPENTNDLWIATCSIYYEAPLLTNNRRHFIALEDLSLADETN